MQVRIQKLKCYIADLWSELPDYLLATLIMGTGIALFISCELGSDPVSIFLDGMYRKYGISPGITDTIISVMLLTLAFIFNRGGIGSGSIMNALLIGIGIDIPMLVLALIDIQSKGIVFRLFLLFTAQVLLGYSFAKLQNLKSGMSTIDAVLYKVIEVFHIKYATARLVYDAIFLLAGTLLGGKIGIGTIFSVLTTGLFTEYFSKKFRERK